MKDNLYFFEEVDGCVRTAPFYVLKRGEKFKFKGETYTKISDDNGKCGNIKRGFWPQHTIYLMKPIKRSELIDKYPILGNNYWS